MRPAGLLRHIVNSEVDDSSGGGHLNMADVKLLFVISQQTQDIEPMVGQCWADVVDGGPTLTHCLFAGM